MPAGSASRPLIVDVGEVSVARRERLPRLLIVAIAVVGFGATVGLTANAHRKPGVFWAETKVIFAQHPSSSNPAPIGTGSGNLIATAGLVSSIINQNASKAQPVSPTVPLYSLGVRHGTWVRLPNDGGQWANNYDQSLLDVQAVGSSDAEVRSRMNGKIAQIRQELRAVQVDVPPADRIVTRDQPPAVTPIYLSGSHTRAEAATLLVGLGITAAAIVAVRRGFQTRKLH